MRQQTQRLDDRFLLMVARVPPHTVAFMTAIAVEVRRTFDIPLGINVLRNDAR